VVAHLTTADPAIPKNPRPQSAKHVSESDSAVPASCIAHSAGLLHDDLAAQWPGNQPAVARDPGSCRTFGVPPSFFFDDYDDQQAGLRQEQVEMLSMIRDAGITSIQLSAFTEPGLTGA
jgi:hypothetical protein